MKSKKIKRLRAKCQIRNLLLVAISDGTMDQLEMDFLFRKAEEYNIDLKKLQKILKNPEKVKPAMPDNLGDRIILLYELVEIMLLDGIIATEELATCRKIAKRMDVIPDAVDCILRDIERNIRRAA